MKLARLLIAVLFVGVSPLAFARQTSLESHPIEFPLPPGSYTHVAKAGNFNWHDQAAWVGNAVPTSDAIVRIPVGSEIVIRTQIPQDMQFICVEGTLRFSIHQTTRLRVDTIYVADSGTLALGNPNNRMRVDRTCEVVFVDSPVAPPANWDPKELSLGLVSRGAVKIYGQDRTPWAELVGSATIGEMMLNFTADVPTDWAKDDELVVAGTRFDRDRDDNSNESELHDEKVVILNTPTTNPALAPDEIDLVSALTEDHLALGVTGPDADRFRIHVANLTRNIIFSSAVKDEIQARGHIMLMNPDVEIIGAAFEGLGRTDKTIPLDEITFHEDMMGNGIVVNPNPSIQNRRGRYSLHFHQNNLIFPAEFDPAAAPPSKVLSCVVNDAVGWGFVNHSSHVEFSDCVAYDFAGAGFVTESGDELGHFYGNIAIHGTGVLDKYFLIRSVFQSFVDCPDAKRPQYLGDFAFGGDGFWFQGPMLRVVDNVASSCNGAGMIWFTTGAVDIGDGDGWKPYVGIKRDVWRTVYDVPGFDINQMNPRFWWDDPNASTFPPLDERNYVIGDLPILENRDFKAYGCLVGHRLRFVNANHTAAFYNDHPDAYGNGQRQVDGGPPTYVPQEVSGITCWNNFQGIRCRYTRNTTWRDVLIDNVHSYNLLYAQLADNAYSAGELFHVNEDLTIADSEARGYSVGFWVEEGEPPIEFLTTLNMVTVEGAASDYADDYIERLPMSPLMACPQAEGLMVAPPTTTTAQLTWNGNSGFDRIAIRYRLQSSTVWQRVTVDGALTTTTLTNLDPGSAYTCQIIAGNGNDVSEWTPTVDFTTL
ncbi:MAG: G8 domain-containing protein [Planctomycetota bacterium]